MNKDDILWPELPPDSGRVTRRRFVVLGSKLAAGTAAVFGGLVSFAPSQPFARQLISCETLLMPAGDPCLTDCQGPCLGGAPSCCSVNYGESSPLCCAIVGNKAQTISVSNFCTPTSAVLSCCYTCP